MKDILDTIVIGGGQAGLASGFHLQKKGLRFLIIEASNHIGGSWPSYYDSLKLFSPAGFSSMPGMKFPGNQNRYPKRDEVVRYLQEYKNKFQLPVLINQRVELIENNKIGFTVRTVTGDTFQTRSIINATGSFNNPYIPKIQGNEVFQGKTLHSSEYRNTELFLNQRIIVIGGGNSAVQIAVELSEVSQTTLSVRQPIKFVKQHLLGRDIHYWLKVIGLDTFPFWRFGKTAPRSKAVNDTGGYKDRISKGNPEQRLMFTSFYEGGVIWPDGEKEPVDTIIYATGFRPHLPYMKLLGALDGEGMPLQKAGISSIPGLYFVGLEGQRSFASATLRGVGEDAEYVVKKLLHHLKSNF
ncbi:MULTISPECIES: NAD(P)-binding domain-containing protein [unclassified Lysinibacillus]|uniref:flavin-containing monooxygenase n=1 Tax=unclassified Lysinibacillus TaxID=2636778 RepID=UPI00088A796A|nr:MULTISPECIES: NAD(P)-binding domain-containing protein [unclassified Lysinibacillus]SCY41914.1 putative flavoprotein involved in K+ transport [Lysinibacillus sp. SG9]SDB19313.1 putative flavoprotein involved in K+ transport [Lysinibacillus sp. TC-37]SFS67772.1 putative flavoprotein involved in K+ transport [Lysinibacillus sp. SG55]